MMALTRINNNITALKAIQNLSNTSEDLAQTLERLSSGVRISSAADDAAGLSISENLRTQIAGVNQAIDNASTAINLVNTAEGALAETTACLQRIRTLAVKAADTGNNDDSAIKAMQDEISSMIEEITRIGSDTQFASQNLISGDFANTASFVGGTNLGVSVAANPTNSTLSSGTHLLKVTQLTAGSETLSNGTDAVNNSGATAFTGSTFDTGSYDLVISSVVAAKARVVSTGGTITTNGVNAAASGSLLNGLQMDGYAIDAADELRFSVVESDGTSTAVNLTVGTTNTISDVVSAINTAIGSDSASYDETSGQFVITAGSAGVNSNLSISLSVDDGAGGAPYEQTLSNTVREAGSDASAVMTIGGGEAQIVTAGQTVTLYGLEPEDKAQVRPQITFTLGSTLTEGTDVVSVVQQSYSASLDGGEAVVFQNGDQNVLMLSGDEADTPIGERLTLDFGATIALGGTTARTFVISAVNNSLGFQIGANADQAVNVAFGDLRATNLGFTDELQANGKARTVAEIDVTTLAGANEALAIIDEALHQVGTQRSTLGAFTNRLESTMSNLAVAAENLTTAESRIRDMDIAVETTRYTRDQILMEAGMSVLSQANLAPQKVLSLLENV